MYYSNTAYRVFPTKPFILVALLGLGLMVYLYQGTKIDITSDDFLDIIAHSRSASNLLDPEQRVYVNLSIFLQAGTGLAFIMVPFIISIYRNRAVLKRLHDRANYVQSIREEFHLRKLSSRVANSSFEKILLRKFSNLTAYDLKMCALLRNNYSSKEIAEELNITPGSVNTARYRLRKKLNLPKETDLVVFLNKVN